MIRLGLRLAVAGGREAITRLAMIAIAVAIGSALLLTTLASINAFDAQNHRYSWFETGYPGAEPTGRAVQGAVSGVDPVWWLLQGDTFRGKEFARVDVAATGPHSPTPPGIPALPGPGQFYASPSLAKLLRDTPAVELGDRYPGTQIGIIGNDALPAPDTLAIIIGRDVASLADEPGAHQITHISDTSPSACNGDCAPTVGTDSDGMTLVLSVVAAALLFPVLIFIGGATRLSAARREQRFAAMRLVGATPRQISTISTVESSIATIVGVALGFGLFAVARPVVATIPFSGERFFTSDLSLSLANVVLVALGVPVAAAIAARIALRRVNISPLGVSRRTTPRPPKPRRLLLLVAGVAWLAYLAFYSDIRTSWSTINQAYAYLLGVFGIMIGLVVAGPWLTLIGSRLTVRRANKPASLIAARRLSDNPQSAFRAVSGLVLAVFVATCAIGIITTIVAYNGGSVGKTVNSRGTIVREYGRGPDSTPTTTVPAGLPTAITAVPGGAHVAILRANPAADVLRRGPEGHPIIPPDFVTCAALLTAPALGHCPADATVAAIQFDFGGGVIDRTLPMSEITWPAADQSVEQIAALPIDLVVVSTNGTPAAVEQARTVLEHEFPHSLGFAPETLSEIKIRSATLINRYQRLANVVLLTSLPIAGCSLAVAVAGGLAERRRPFSLLRLTGAPLSMLRRVVSLEAAVPLLISVVVAAGAGMLAAGLFLHAQLRQTLQAPGLEYYAIIIGGVLASFAIIASTLPLLNRVTGPETARND